MIELTGDYEFAAPRELVWEMLLDPEVLAMTIPGCEKLDSINENAMQGRLNMRVGPIQCVFQGKIESSEVRPPDGFHMVINGSGPAGAVRGEGDMTLLPSSDATTRLHYEGKAQVSGRIASVGQRVMDSSARSIVEQSLQNLERQIQARVAPQPELQAVANGGQSSQSQPRPAAVAPAAPNQTEFMVNVARDVIGDLLPNSQLRTALLGAGVAVAVIGLINAFANLIARRVAKILKEG